MSVAAARRYENGIIFAADSIVVRAGYFQEKKEGVKLWRSPMNLIVATAGSVQEAAIMRMFTQTHRPESATEHGILAFLHEFGDWQNKRTNSWGVKNHYLFGFQNMLFETHGLCILPDGEFAAIGAGFDTALTAMYLGKTPYEACEIACELSPYCEKPVHQIKMDYTKEGGE